MQCFENFENLYKIIPETASSDTPLISNTLSYVQELGFVSFLS